MSVVRTRYATLDFQQTRHGPIVVLNGRYTFSVREFLHELLDAYYRLDLQHPGGSAAWLQEMTGMVLDDSCPLCDRPGEIASCPVCTIGRCARCARTHDSSPLCLLTVEYADLHCEIRGGDECDQSDWYFARRSIASTHLKRQKQ